MKKITLYLFIVFSFLPLAAAQEFYYDVDLYYNRGNLSLTSLTLKPLLDEMEVFNYGESVVEIVSFNNSVLFESPYDIPLLLFVEYFVDGGRDGETIILNQTEVPVNLPYFKNAKEINFYDEEKNLLLSVDVGRYAKGIDAEKILEGKPKEKPKEEVPEKIEEKVTEEKKEEKVEMKPVTKVLIGTLSGIGLMILLIFIIVLLKRKRE